MNLDPHGILWPSLGYPADVSPENEGTLRVVVYPIETELEPAMVTARLTIVGGPAESFVELRCNDVRMCSINELSDLGNWSPWVRAAAPSVTVFFFSISQITPQCRTRVYDLEINVAQHTYAKPSSVFVRRAGSRDFAIAVASDIHVASRWDDIEADLATFFPGVRKHETKTVADLLECSSEDIFSRESASGPFINPNRNFGNFLRFVNRMASEGKIDAIILSGDLVDFKYQEVGGSNEGCHSTEWELFQRILLGQTKLSDRLTVPLFTTTGNHDYRLFSYRLQVYGIRHCAIADEITCEYLRRSDRLSMIKYRIGDLSALRVNLGAEHSLNNYYHDINPFDDYDTEIGGLRTIFLDSGPDATSDRSHLVSRRWWRYVRGIFKIAAPQSTGISDAQVQYLTNCIERNTNRSVLLVTHAPFMIPKVGSSEVTEAKKCLELPVSLRAENATGPPGDDPIAFEEELAKASLSEGSLMRNQLPCLRALEHHHGATLMLSGHGHRKIEISLDKEDGRLRRHWCIPKREFRKEMDSNLVWMLQTPALGHINIKDSVDGRPAYRLVRTLGGEIDQVTTERLSEPPLDSWWYEWKARSVDSTREAVGIYFDPPPAQVVPDPAIFHRVILRFSRPRSKGTKGQASQFHRIRVVPPREGVLASRCWDSVPGMHLVAILFNDVRFAELIIEDRPRDARVVFLFESFLQNSAGFTSFGLRRHFRDLDIG